ncbi:hexosaminidase [Microterricola gilva]|uniref:beta-N-acetylhexosaminidase n=1 Tax=Microterricola gilva TaxID=393267 RepID=A0A4Q8APW0_9MICO|nr:family 20 glycosylhydrolase [Microterricola gilva]RZU66143.1 hexosaminidase [Microterricola gilva]
MSVPVIPLIHTARRGASDFALTPAVPVVAPAELEAVARRFVSDLATDSPIDLDVATDAPLGVAIRLELAADGLDALPATGGIRADGDSHADERHGLAIAENGIRVWGATPEAVHRGLTTLRQLITAHAGDGVAQLPALEAVDAPRFAWRGLSLDVARTFHDVETVRRVIDMCSLYKLNVLHLHLTDDQGWRLEVPEWPSLTEVGARGAFGDRQGGFYTRADVASLVDYAADRFVTIVPEIDMPGHTAAVFASYPELAPENPLTIESIPGFDLSIGTLDPDRELTWTFVNDVVRSAVEQFRQSAYVHLGGDEAFGMADEAHAAFVDRAISVIKDHGKLALGWQEIARAGIGAGDVVQYWMEPNESADGFESDALKAMVPEAFLPMLLETLAKSVHDVPTALDKGATLLVSPTSRLYFDRPHLAESADPAQEETRARVGLPVYPPASLRDGVEWDPIDETPVVDSDDRIGGVEAAVWCETVTSRDDLEFLLLPRLAGAGEKAWAARNTTEWASYSARLAGQAGAWDRRGWNWFRSSEVAWPAPAVAQAQ